MRKEGLRQPHAYRQRKKRSGSGALYVTVDERSKPSFIHHQLGDLSVSEIGKSDMTDLDLSPNRLDPPVE
jgi:hypothetical protein